jgi:hypothetical protein
MFKLSLTELEIARRKPRAFRDVLDRRSKGEKRRFSWGYYNALREAIRHFHKMNESVYEAHSYLENGLERFKDLKRSQETVDQLAWYIGDYFNRGWISTQTYSHIIVPLEDIGVQLRCSGEISRLDIVPTGGYAAWLFRSREPDGWRNELRMPIVQDVAARMLGVSNSEIKVGVISFQERYSEFHSYSGRQIVAAYKELEVLLAIMFPVKSEE